MAKTYTATALSVAFASNKSLLGLFNAHASRKVRLYRVWALNNQTAAVTGVLTTMQLRKVSALSAGTTVTPTAHDTANATADLTSVTCNTGGTFTNTGEVALRQIMWSGDEPSVSSATSDELQCIIPLMCIWDATGDNNIEPLTLNTSEGVHLIQPGANAVGVLDVIFEFTVS